MTKLTMEDKLNQMEERLNRRFNEKLDSIINLLASQNPTINDADGEVEVEPLTSPRDIRELGNKAAPAPSKSAKKSRGRSFIEFIVDCKRGKSTYPGADCDFQKIQKIDGVGYYVVLKSFVKKDTFKVLEFKCEQRWGHYDSEFKAFAFPTLTDAKAFVADNKHVNGNDRLQHWIAELADEIAEFERSH